MMLFEFSIDLEDELTRLLGKYHIIIPRPIVKELKFLAEHGKGKKKIIAKPALTLISKYEIVDVDKNVSGDKAVFHLTKKFNGFALTNDRDLRKKLHDASLKSICLRGKKQLILK
jgi:rRNA-processing protein FCF1